MKGALLVAGTSSDAGKSIVAAGICRWLAREGVKVAPFKAQNMALNSFVTKDGAEIGRAQAAQAMAAGIEPEAAMNPVLLKPSGGGRTQVVVKGKPWAQSDAVSYQQMKRELMPVVLESLAELKDRFDVVICEGAGSPAEINLRPYDLVNMGLAQAAQLPVLVVGDIDRGGVFAGLFGTLALLSKQDQALVGGFLINKFRGDGEVLAPGLKQLQNLTDRPVLGVLPWVEGLGLDEEDSLALRRREAGGSEPGSLRVAVARLPRISNFTDFDPLIHELNVSLSFTDSAAEVLEADLAVLPGTKATVEDLLWLRSRGLDAAFTGRARRGLPVLGICGGYQMLGERVVDGIESGRGEVPGLGILPVETVFGEDKVLGRPEGVAVKFGGERVSGYEIHHGRVARSGGEPVFLEDSNGEGCMAGETLGTSRHGIMESDGFREALLKWVAGVRGVAWEPGGYSFTRRRQERLEALGDLIAENVDREAVLRLIQDGAPPGLPVLSHSLTAVSSRLGTKQTAIQHMPTQYDESADGPRTGAVLVGKEGADD